MQIRQPRKGLDQMLRRRWEGRRGWPRSGVGRAVGEEDQVRDCDWERDLIRAKREIGRNRVRGDLPEQKIEVRVGVARGIWSGPQERGGERERDRVQGELLRKMIKIRAGVVRERVKKFNKKNS